MTWEQLLVRHGIKGFVWAACFFILCALLGLVWSWQLLVFAIVLSFIDKLLDALIPNSN